MEKLITNFVFKKSLQIKIIIAMCFIIINTNKIFSQCTDQWGMGINAIINGIPIPSIGTNPFTIGVNTGDVIHFDVSVNSADPGIEMSLSVIGLPMGATMTPPLPIVGVNPLYSYFDWTVGTLLTAETMTFLAEDSCGREIPWTFIFIDTSCMSVIRDTTYCDSTGTYIYEFQVFNNSPTRSIEQLEITVDSPEPPEYVVAVPSTINVNPVLPPRTASQVYRVKLIGPGSNAYVEVCYTLSAHYMHEDCPWCCYIENCIKLPVCSCAEVIQDSLYCSGNQYYYNFTLQNGTQYNITKIQLTSPGINPITFVPQIFHFGSPILPGQIFPNLTAGILGGAAGLTIPIKFKLFSDDFECCYFESLYTLPSCDTASCDSAMICAKTLCPDDQITVCLANSISPYNILFTATAVSDANGCAYYKFPGASPGASYYIVLKSQKSLETWSATPQVINGAHCLEYDFTSDSSRAYGNNMMNINGVWYLYSGDINQDGVIDLTDVLLVFNGANMFQSGITDLNCDGITDLTDYVIVFNNSQNFVQILKP